jgi:Ankyrin repeats (3 copies)
MSTNFSYCSSVSRYVPNTGADSISSRITKKTTPEEFDKMRKEFPQFQLWHPTKDLHCTVLHTAAWKGNARLVEYLVKQAPELLERGDKICGFTPLCGAIRDPDTLRTLLELGANPNVMLNPKGPSISLLQSAIITISKESMVNGSQIAKLLLKHGAERHPQDDVLLEGYEGAQTITKSIIQKASQEAAEERREEQRAVRETIYNTELTPMDLCGIVSEYI